MYEAVAKANHEMLWEMKAFINDQKMANVRATSLMLCWPCRLCCASSPMACWPIARYVCVWQKKSQNVQCVCARARVCASAATPSNLVS